MFTKKQLVISIGLTVIGNAMMVTAANADDISATSLSGSNFVGTNAVNSNIGDGASTQGIVGGIPIPPGLNVPGSGTSGTSSGGSGGSGSSSTGDGSGSTGTITVADIAEYFASSIDRSLKELDTSSTVASTNKPRRIVRRRNSASCPNPQISRSSESLDDLLNQSEQFLEQVEQVKPENSAW